MHSGPKMLIFYWAIPLATYGQRERACIINLPLLGDKLVFVLFLWIDDHWLHTKRDRLRIESNDTLWLFSHSSNTSIKILKLPIIKNGWINVQDIFFVYPISYLPYFNKIKHKVLRAFLKKLRTFRDWVTLSIKEVMVKKLHRNVCLVKCSELKHQINTIT